MASRKYITQLANSIIGKSATAPIKIDKIIKDQGLKLVPYEEDGVSGILMVEKSSATIGYATNEPRERQRFTKAHELGHFLLHRGGNLFIDKKSMSMYRPSNGAPSNDWQEWEANEFAACILMPEHLVREEMKNIQIDYADDESGNTWIKKLADIFEVSVSAMSIRISKLGL
ncbi:MAG: ImmA/IrrE family metallo-endopeptidase [Ferruginibacter sp.]